MSTPSPTETDTSLPFLPQTLPSTTSISSAQSVVRPIYSFFGGGSSSASSSTSLTVPTAPTPAQSAPKRKRKKVEDPSSGTQARLSLGNGSEGGKGKAWTLGRLEVDTEEGKRGTLNGNGGGRSVGGEEAELKEMSQKVVMAKGKGKGRAKRKVEDEVGSAMSQQVGRPQVLPDSDDMLMHPSLFAQGDTSSGSAGVQTVSPSKRKRGRSRKSQQPSSSSIDHPSASHPNHSALVTSSPIAITVDHVQTPSKSKMQPRGIHPQTDDFEITRCSIGGLDGGGHPTFSRTASRGVGPDDAIEVDEHQLLSKPEASPQKTAARPTKIAFASDSKPTHSFFSRVEAEGGRSRASSVASDALPRPHEDGLKLVETVLRQREKGEKRGKQTHSFFRLAAAGQAGALKNGWGKEERNTPLPGMEWPSHTSGGLSYYEWQTRAGPSRRAKPAPTSSIDDAYWSSAMYKTSDQITLSHSISSNSVASSTVPFLSQHPAFESIPSKSKSSTANREPWSDRYRPLQSSEVLHNELETTYLRDWLSTLAVGHHDGRIPRVVRKVRRTKARSALVEGWIVDDLGLYGEPRTGEAGMALEEEEDGIELEELEGPEISPDFDKRHERYPSFESRLTNTILLTGSHGSGKSAAVYAAAHELGWDVFEVYAGIGKRTGGNLMSWVGDVGRNHMVANGGKEDSGERKRSKPEKEKRPGEAGIQSFFGTGAKSKLKTGLVNGEKKRDVELGSQGSAAEPIDIAMDDEYIALDDDRPIAVSPPENHAAANEDTNGALVVSDTSAEQSKVRQSLILIDEADVLFDEEATFWPAVISLIAESRRPVVLTCNDLKRIPRDQLPLQAILQYCPPPSHIAIPYLRAIAAQEIDAQRNDMLNLNAIVRDSTHRQDDRLLDQPLPPNGNELIPYLDLRRAITQLQLEGGHTPQAEDDDSTKVASVSGLTAAMDNELNSHLARMDAVSYVDAHVDLRPWAKMETLDIDRPGPCPDDEMGVHILGKSEIRDSYPVLAGYDRAPEIARTYIELAGGDSLPALGNLNVSRARYIRSTLPLLDPLIPLSAPLLPHHSLFLYTLPVVLSMIGTDDVLESAEQEAVRRGEERINRKTGRPIRGGGGYVRWLDLEDEAVDVARGLNWQM
ncbi:hypothetical protein IAR55_001527 [Kwoniella newhampshirensis]|uniref:AAA+ ATPase domain-containing protein n=1 Tax=Kwoniella newhampshirensis TaxID=1651941 RepID=A0AAW0Z2F0_9TREE